MSEYGCAGCGQSTYGQRHGACERCEGGYDDEEDYPRD
ncbi:hypothetical protein SEA_DUNCANSLEG_72 [Mycobacterium phage DuncansLeg]|nr:hypothetical protein SEA_DUNCANSLEG_72 [Mycobacterium phage DuncansLeg]